MQGRSPRVGPNDLCEKCPALVASRKLYEWGRPTWGYGNPRSKIAFVGEAPGWRGCGRTGIPFNGDKSGDLFQECLALEGLTLDDVYTTNVVKCCPPGNRTPTWVEHANCREWLAAELDATTVKVVVALGRSAIDAFIEFAGPVSSMIGSAMQVGGIVVVPYYHPAWALRSGQVDNYKEAFRRILSCRAVGSAGDGGESPSRGQGRAEKGQS